MNLIEELQEAVLCGDGAMGTELMAAGAPLDASLDELNLSRPDLVLGIHEAYVQAGARLLETNTFGANAGRLSKYGLEGKVAEINRAGVNLARRAIGNRAVYLAGSVGPLDLADEWVETHKIDRASVFRNQLEALLDVGVDVIFFETFIDLEELEVGLRTLRELDPVIPVIGSMSCSEEGRLPSSLPVIQAFRDIVRFGANIVGVNCVTGPHAMTRILRRLPSEFLLSAFPNAGYPRYQSGRFYYSAAPEYFAAAAKEFVDNGARLIGGCCGVRPEHVAAMVTAIKDLKPIRSQPVLTWLDQKPPLPDRRPHETSILDLMARGQTVVVTELDPPKTLDLEKYFSAAQTLVDAGTDAITLADNSLAILRVSNLAVGAILKQKYNIMPLLHVSCRDKNLLGLQSELMGVAALGIRHVLPLTGDPAKFGDQPGASSVYDVNSVQLIEIIASLNKGYNFAGRAIRSRANLVIGCTFNPNVKNLDTQVSRLQRKIAAGAQFVMTQPVFERRLVKEMYERTRDLKIPILTGVWPLLNARQTEYLHHEVPGILVPDSVRTKMAGREGAEGKRLGLEIAKEMIESVLEYFPGVYLITPFLAYDTTAELSQFVRKLSS
jgi:methionine synthase / methylenetetrahydrofolate reductase(NADPH)